MAVALLTVELINDGLKITKFFMAYGGMHKPVLRNIYTIKI